MTPSRRRALSPSPPYATDKVALHVEIERDLSDRLRESARANDRKVNAEVERAIRFYLEHGQ